MNINPAKSELILEQSHESPLHCCAFDSGGRFVLAGGRDRSLISIDLRTKKKSLLQGHEGWISAINSAGSELVLSCDYSGNVIAWDCTGNEPKQHWEITAHTSTINAISQCADNKSFATGDREGMVRIWSTNDGKRLQEFPRIPYSVTGVAMLPDGNRIVTANRQPKTPKIQVWEIGSGKEALTIEVPELSGYRRVEDIEWGGIRELKLSPDGKRIIAAGRFGYDGPAIALEYDSSTGKLQHKYISTLKGFCYCVKFHPEGYMIVASGEIGKGEYRYWKTEKEVSVAEVATPGPCTSLDLHSKSQHFAFTQMIGKGSYPDSGKITIHRWLV